MNDEATNVTAPEMDGSAAAEPGAPDEQTGEAVDDVDPAGSAPDVISEAEAEPVPDAGTDLELVVGLEPPAQEDPEAALEADSEVDVEPAVGAVPKTDSEVALELAADVEPAAEAELEAVAWVAPEAELEADVGDAPDAEPDAWDAEADAQLEDSIGPPVDTLQVALEETSPATPETVPLGRHVARMLHAAGIRWAFTVPGESFLGLLDELTDAGIHVVGTRHESGAAFMAEAVGQLTGRPALCLATRAVGAANLGIGIHTARADSTPLIAVAGQVPRDVRGREAFQEADLVSTIGGLAKWAAEPSSAADAPDVVAEGLRQAVSGRPGPVLLSFPEDMLDEDVSAAPTPTVNHATAGRPDPVAVRSVLQLLAEAERPVILAGAGVLRARCSTDLARLAEFLRVPVIASWRRGDVIPNDHPLFLGMTGYGAPAVVRERLETADAALVLGSRLNEITTSGYAFPHEGQRWAHVDLEPRVGEVSPAPDLALASDARSFVRAALDRLRGAALDAASADARGERNVVDRAAWEAAAVVDAEPWDGPGLHPGRVVMMLRRLLADDAIVTTDAGNMAGWLARGFRFSRPGTFLGPTSGAMGYGLPAAIAAALVHRDRTVVAWTGDGGFAMTMAELETAVRMHLRLTVLVLDNERYGTIRMHQDQRGVPAPAATDLGPIDFAAIARGLGAHGSRPSTEAELESALRIALLADRPSVIQVQLDRRWVSVDRPAV